MPSPPVQRRQPHVALRWILTAVDVVVVAVAFVYGAPAVALALAVLAAVGFLAAGRALVLPIVFAVSLLMIPARYSFGPFAVTIASLTGAVALVLWWAGRMVAHDSRPARASSVMRALLFFLFTVMVGFAVAQVRGVTGSEASNADRRIFFTIAAVGLVAYVVDTVRSVDLLRRIIGVTVAAGGLMAVIGIIQFATGFDPVRLIALPGLDPGPPFRISNTGIRRVASTASHPIEFGVVCAMLLPLAMHLGAYAQTVVRRLSSSAVAAVLAAGVLLSVSRSALLATVAVMLVLMPRWLPTRRFKMFVFIGLGLALFAVLVPDLPGALTDLFADTANDPSIEGRTEATSEALELIGERPLLGRGFGTWDPAATFVVDNQYLVTLLETGALGVLGVVVLGRTSFLVAKKVARATEANSPETADLARSLSASLVAVAIGAFGLNILRFQASAGLLFLVVGLIAALDQLCRRDGGDEHRSTGVPVPPAAVPAN